MIFLIPFFLSFQDPVPEEDLMEKVMEAVDQVKQGFLDLDRQLHISMGKVDANPEGGSELRKSLGQAARGEKQGGKNRISFFDSRGKSQSIDQERPNELED